MSKYLDIAKSVHVDPRQADRTSQSRTEAADTHSENLNNTHDKSDISDQSPIQAGREVGWHTTLTVREVLQEIKRTSSGAAINARLFREGEITKENAIQWIACAILHRRGASFESWRGHAPAVEAALTHPIDCKYEERF